MVRYKQWVIIEDDYNKPINMTTKENFDAYIQNANLFVSLENFDTTSEVIAYIDKYLRG